jgi:hypothetical protein
VTVSPPDRPLPNPANQLVARLAELETALAAAVRRADQAEARAARAEREAATARGLAIVLIIDEYIAVRVVLGAWPDAARLAARYKGGATPRSSPPVSPTGPSCGSAPRPMWDRPSPTGPPGSAWPCTSPPPDPLGRQQDS